MENTESEMTLKLLAETKITLLILEGKNLDLEEVQVKRIIQDILTK